MNTIWSVGKDLLLVMFLVCVLALIFWISAELGTYLVSRLKRYLTHKNIIPCSFCGSRMTVETEVAWEGPFVAIRDVECAICRQHVNTWAYGFYDLPTKYTSKYWHRPIARFNEWREDSAMRRWAKNGHKGKLPHPRSTRYLDE